mmetsp:Transcript_1541/g.3634  ORF Transcript_1541/g.3634 Transcript_1541/m.3634 type:complete len:270 (-) Transcript_1541:147-956(-)
MVHTHGALGSNHVLAEHSHVQVPVGHLGLPLLHLPHGKRTHGQRSHARGTTHALLPAGIAAVDLPFVQFYFHSAYGGDCVQHQEAAVLFTHHPDRLHVPLEAAGGGLGVAQPQQVRLVLAQPVFHFRDRERLAGGFLDLLHFLRVPPVQVQRPLAEIPIHADQVHIAHLRQVRDASLPGGRPGPRNRDRKLVPSLPHVPQQVLDVFDDPKEVAVHVSDLGEAHRRVHPRIGVLRPGAEQQPPHRVQADRDRFRRQRILHHSRHCSCRPM